jgi:dihydroorotate dehydrogenase electron transfer subunit
MNKYRVIENTEAAPGHYKLILDMRGHPHLPLPGQFYSIRCGDSTSPLLRRPFSMHRLVKGQSVEILYRVVGPGTSWLAKRQAEDVLDVLGPFGNGFNIEETLTHAVLVARGVGIAPLYALGEVLKRESPSVRVSVLMGARLKERIFYRNELEALGSVHCYTEVPSGLLSSIGLQNVGVARFIQAKLPF